MEKKARGIPPGKERKVMGYMKPLTPEFREQINESIKSQEIELDSCQNTPYVAVIRVGLRALENLINALPDGYPIPMKRSDGE